MAWLEAEAADRSSSTTTKRKPPRLPGAPKTLPPMPHVPSNASIAAMPAVAAPPPRRHTMEVDMSWLELVDDKAKAASGESADDDKASKKKKKKHKPIPRED